MAENRMSSLNSSTIDNDIQYCIDRMNNDSTTIEDRDLERRAFKSVDKAEVTQKENVTIYKKPKSDSSSFEAKRRSMNYDSHQLCFLMYTLFQKGYVTTVSRSYKKSMVIDQVFRVKCIEKDGKKRFSDTMFDGDEYSYNGDIKKRRRNMDATTNNIMLYLMEGEHVTFETRKCKEMETVSLDNAQGKKRLKWIKVDGKIFNRDDIDYIGEKMYNIIVPKIRRHDYMLCSEDITELCARCNL